MDLICGMAEFCDTNAVRVISDGNLLHGKALIFHTAVCNMIDFDM